MNGIHQYASDMKVILSGNDYRMVKAGKIAMEAVVRSGGNSLNYGKKAKDNIKGGVAKAVPGTAVSLAALAASPLIATVYLGSSKENREKMEVLLDPIKDGAGNMFGGSKQIATGAINLGGGILSGATSLTTLAVSVSALGVAGAGTIGLGAPILGIYAGGLALNWAAEKTGAKAVTVVTLATAINATACLVGTLCKASMGLKHYTAELGNYLAAQAKNLKGQTANYVKEQPTDFGGLLNHAAKKIKGPNH